MSSSVARDKNGEFPAMKDLLESALDRIIDLARVACTTDEESPKLKLIKEQLRIAIALG